MKPVYSSRLLPPEPTSRNSPVDDKNCLLADYLAYFYVQDVFI
jgi:hypothetical protein